MHHRSSRLAAFLALLLSFQLVLAQDRKPSNLEPLPEPPPPPPGYEPDASLEPQITIVKRGEDLVQEYRIQGRLYMMKIIPAVGVPYYLIDTKGNGSFVRRDSLDEGFSPPMWVILEF